MAPASAAPSMGSFFHYMGAFMKKSHFRNLAQLACASILCIGTIQSAAAGIIFSQTIPETGTVTNIRFDLPGSTPGPGTTVTGTAGPLNNRYLIDFAGKEELIANVAAPPLVRALDGTLRELDISVRDGGFTTLFLNFRAVSGGALADRFADIAVSAFGGETASYRLALGTGNNLFRVDATDDTVLRLVSISSMIGLSDVRQPRIAGLQPAPVEVPEPASLLSLGIGMAGLLAVRRRRH